MTEQRRADERLALHSPIEVAGIDSAGRQFNERAALKGVSDAGCRFSLGHEVQPGGNRRVETARTARQESDGRAWALVSGDLGQAQGQALHGGRSERPRMRAGGY